MKRILTLLLVAGISQVANAQSQNEAPYLTKSLSGANIQKVQAETSGGNVSLSIPGNKGIDLKLSGDKVKAGKLNNFSGSIEEDSIDGKLNGGGIPVTVKGHSGRVTLTIK